MEFWSDAQLASIDRMLNPRSIAVVGATPRMQYGGRFLAAAMGSMERGVNVYPVNPRYEGGAGAAGVSIGVGAAGGSGRGGSGGAVPRGAGHAAGEP